MIKHYRHLLLAFLLLCNIAIVQAQNITLNLKNVTVKEAIEAVKEQTGKSFFFNVNDVDLNRRVNIVLKEASLGDALSQILQGQNIGYEVKENHIVLTKKITKKADPFIRISGQVTDESGVPLIGVNISVKDGANTVTDIDGNYSIQAAPGTTLTFSYIGFLSQKVKVNDQRNINIQLVEDTKALNEVVVIGYGTQKKANLTGAVDAISSKEIEDRPVATLGRALQGAVPNLNISYGSGRPNEGTSINIRGFGSINEEAKPLVLIDGVEGDGVQVTLVDMGTHFRIICADIELVKQPKPMPKLPVARIMYRHKPNFEIGTAFWCYAGGAHHSVVSTALTRKDIAMFAKLTGTEFVAFGDDTTEADLEKFAAESYRK